MTDITGLSLTITKGTDDLYWVKVFFRDDLLVHRSFESEHEAKKSADDVMETLRAEYIARHPEGPSQRFVWMPSVPYR